MSIQFSPVITARKRGGGAFTIKAFELDELAGAASPVVVLDDFRVRGQPFPPHPHAGFSAVTYVFEDSDGALRSRDSLGNDVVVGPGGLVWTLAGRGVLHHEVPAQADHELHGLQLFVNLSAKNKLAAPRMVTLADGDAPEWHNDAGDRVRVVAGSYGGATSPVATVEPFDLLDVKLQREIALKLSQSQHALVYVVDGHILVRAAGQTKIVPGGSLVALASEGRATLEAVRSSHVIVLTGEALNEPVVTNGPFIMNDQSQIAAASARFQAGEMGNLAPLA